MPSLALPPSRIANLQKVCDIYDWFDPAMDHVIRNVLRATPGGNRRQWEFAAIYLALLQTGALRPEARGLGMGVGTERLIYALAEASGQVVATDLYQTDSRWEGVRTEDPKALIEASAPWPVAPGRIIAERADMRRLPYPSESFDFAWSTGAFEHIGDDGDFLANLDETARVLKPGGVYAFTTVIAYAPHTHRIPHNHYFAPDHLMALAHESALTPEPIFDVRLRRHLGNRPAIETLAPFGVGGADGLLWPVSALRRGTITVANLVLLRKTGTRRKAPPEVIGFAETSEWVWGSARAMLRRLWENWQAAALTPREDGWTATALLDLPAGPMEAEADCLDRDGGAIALRVVSRRPSPPLQVRKTAPILLAPGGPPATFAVEEGRVYGIHLRREDGRSPETLRLRLRHATAS